MIFMIQVKTWAKLLNTFCTNGKLELELMYKVQMQCYEDAKLMKLFPEIVRSLYDQDVLAEDTILHWFRKGMNPKGRYAGLFYFTVSEKVILFFSQPLTHTLVHTNKATVIHVKSPHGLIKVCCSLHPIEVSSNFPYLWHFALYSLNHSILLYTGIVFVLLKKKIWNNIFFISLKCCNIDIFYVRWKSK